MNARCLFIFIAFCLLTSSVCAEGYSYSHENLHLRLRETASDGTTELRLQFTGESCSSNNIFQLSNPTRLVVDIPKRIHSKNYETSNLGSHSVKELRIGVHQRMTRVVLEMHQQFSLDYQVLSNLRSCEIWIVTESPSPTVGVQSEEANLAVEPPGTESSVNAEFSADYWSRNSRFTSSHESESDIHTHSEIKPQVDLSVSDSVSLKVAGKVDYLYQDTEDSSLVDPGVELDEAHATVLGDGYSVKLGNQRIRWGKTDELSPLDIVSPEDTRDGFARRRDSRKLPVPAINASVFTDSAAVQLLYIPWFKESKFNQHPSRWSTATAGLETVEEEYDRDFEDPDYGGKVDFSVGDIDYSVSYLSTTSDLPALTFVPAGSNSIPFARLDYHRKEVAGASFETATDLFTFRGDLAYTSAEHFTTESLQSEKSPVIETVLGADYLGEDGFYANLQYGLKHLTDYESHMLGQDEYMHSVFGEVWQEVWDNYLKLGSRNFGQLSEKEFYINPYLRIQYWDSVQFELGADVIDGDQGLIGQFDRNDSVYFLLEGTL